MCCCSPPCHWYYLRIVLLDIMYIITTLAVKPLSQICQQQDHSHIYFQLLPGCTEWQWQDHSHISNCYLDVQSGSDRITLISPTATWMYRAAVTGSLSYLQLLPRCTEWQWQDHSHITYCYLDVQSGSDTGHLLPSQWLTPPHHSGKQVHGQNKLSIKRGHILTHLCLGQMAVKMAV